MIFHGQQFLKRIFDLTLSFLLLTVSLPFFIIIALLTKLDSRGPVLFTQKRLGKNGKEFSCLKFRTMVGNAGDVLRHALEKDQALREEWEINFKLKNDPRVTRVGSFLRKTSLDELPQIINVLRGEMSLVGPRPRPLYELEGQKGNDMFYVGLTVRPGITGLWQVSGRNDLDFKQRILLDAMYVQNWSLKLDFLLLFKTIKVVLKQTGAY
nr:sugar transferase [Desulfoscipio gibsoniae]